MRGRLPSQTWVALDITVVIGVRALIEGIEQYGSQKELAKKMGVHPRTIRKWKSGARKPSKKSKTKLRRIRGGFRAHGTKKPIYRKQRVVTDLYGEKRLAQSAGAEGELHGYVDAADVSVFLAEILDILQTGFHGDAYARFQSIRQWMQSGNLYSGIQIGVEFNMRYAEKTMGELVTREGVTMFSISFPPSEADYRDVLNDLIANLIENFRKWVSQSPLDYLAMTFTKWYIISYRYRGLS